MHSVFLVELSTEVENDKLFDCLKVSAAAEFTVPRWRRAPCGFGVKQAEYFLFAPPGMFPHNDSTL
jgi:hypothetical protein